MKLKLTHAEMLAQWKRRRYFEPLRSDCRTVRSDAVDLDSYVADEMRLWYQNLLRTAPAHMLAPQHIASRLAMSRTDSRCGRIIYPDNAVRPVTFKLAGWSRSAEIVTDPQHPLVALQRNQYSAGGPERPVCLWLGDGILEVFSIPSGSNLTIIEQALTVMDNSPDSYEFDELAWSTIV